MPCPATEQLLALMQPLKQLNYYAVQPLRSELLTRAQAVPATDFPVIADFGEELIRLFLDSAWKRSEKILLHDFSDHLKAAFNQLRDEDRVVRAAEDEESTAHHSVALALPQSFTALEWFRLLETARVPTRLVSSVDAVVRRNQTNPTVLALLFELMLRVDRAAAMAWMNRFLEANRGQLDQDLVRDLLCAWREPQELSRDCRKWLFEWCGNEDLRQQWPTVAEEADRVLRRQILLAWLPQLRTARSAWWRRLAGIAEDTGNLDHALLNWQQDAIGELGNAVTAFIKFSRHLGSGGRGQSEADGTGRGLEWSREAVFRELTRMEHLFTPIMLFADTLLATPDGSYRFAMSLLGFPMPELAAWRQKLLRQTTGMVHRAVLEDLKVDRQPIATIRTYSAGDRQLFRYLLSQLDLVSRNFGSLEQRDKVVEQLAIHFSSLREVQLLPRELTSRYRRLMLTIHEDSLHRLLDEARMRQTDNFVIRRDLIAAAAAARRYIQRRRALNTSVEAMIGSRFDFEKNIRQRRLQFARRLWSN